MSEMQGKVQFLNEKPWNGKLLYSFKLFDNEGLFMCGTDKPNMNKGDFVTFEAKENARGQMQVNVRSIKAKTAEVITAGGQGWGGSRSGANDDKRQRTIEYQAARNSAIAAAAVIIDAQALKLPAKESAKYDVVLALIGDLTNKFFEETATLGKVEPKLPEAEEAPAEASDKEEGWDE